MRIGPRDSARPEPGEPGDTGGPEPADPRGERRRTPPPLPHPGDLHVAGLTYNDGPQEPPDALEPELKPEPGPADWVPVQGTSRPEEPGEPEAARHRPSREQEPEPQSPETPQPVRTAPDVAAEAPKVPDAPTEVPTVPDVPAVGRAPRPAVDDGPMRDPQRRRTLVDAFLAEFVASLTWRTTLAVLEGAFPGLGMAATLSRRTDELWRVIGTLDRVGSAGLGVPVRLDGGGMTFDLSARRRPGTRTTDPGPGVRPRASWPYAGALVIDTLDPLRHHRPVGGPPGPGETSPDVPTPPPGEGDDTGVVIVADLTSAGPRVLDSVALWRYAGSVVTATLHDALRPETRAHARRALRALRRVVFVDPDLGLGLCLQIDVGRTPRCLLAFRVDGEEARGPHFVRP